MAVRDPFKNRLGRFIHHRITDLVVIALILLSVGLLFYEVIGKPPAVWSTRLFWIELVITILFILELGIKAYVAPSRKQFLREYWLDILAVLPILRIFRFFRILRLVRIYRVGLLLSRRITFLNVILREGASHTVIIVFLLLTVVLFGSLGIMVTERHLGAEQALEYDDAFWWSLQTIIAGEPIGYEPRSTLGRTIGVIVMVCGLTVFAMFTGIVTAFMVDRLRNRMEINVMDYFNLKDHVLVCGWNRGGPILVEELFRDAVMRERSVVIISERETPPVLDYSTVRRDMVYFIRGDFTRTETLRQANVTEAERAVILSDTTREDRSDQDRDARTLLAALTLEKMNPSIFTCAELINDDNVEHLKMAGVEEVVVANHLSSSILAFATMTYGISEVFKELLTHGYGNQIYRASTPERWVGRSFVQVGQTLKESYDAVLLGLLRNGDDSGPAQTVLNPPPSETLSAEDRFIYMARQRLDFEA